MRRRFSRLQGAFSLCRIAVPHCLFVALLIVAFVSDARAANIRWGTGNGLFHTPANWQGGLIPGVIDVAQFGRSFPMFPQTYTVSFNNNATNQALEIEDDRVTFDLNGRVYTVTAATGVLVGANTGNFSGQLTITDGTLSSSTKIDVGAATNRVGTLIVGAGGLISGAANLNVGSLATGTLNVQVGGNISTTGATTIGVGTGINGTANIVGSGSIGSANLLTGALNVGNTGNGTVNVQLGGLLQNSGVASIGGGNLFTGVGTGVVNVTNPGSVWNSQGLLKVGDVGNGDVNITLGGKVTSVDAIVGADVSNSGEVNVDGPFSLWDNSAALTIGGLGAGILNITNQGTVETSDAIIGSANLATSNGTVNVTGSGSLWTITDVLDVGSQGTGTLNITGGGTVSMLGEGFVGNLTGVSGTVAVSGVNSLWETPVDIIIGLSGEGTLNVSGGGRTETRALYVGLFESGTGQVTVDGVDSVLEYSFSALSPDNTEALVVGDEGDGTLEITNGGQLISTATVDMVINEIGSEAGSTGLVRVTGDGSVWDAGGAASGSITVGKLGNGTLEITAGGAVQTDELTIGESLGSMGTVTVSGSDSLLAVTGRLAVGERGQGTLDINGGGQVITGGTASIAGGPGSTGVANIQGAGSTWLNSGNLTVGNFGVGAMNVTAGALVQNAFGFVGGTEPGTVRVDGLNSRWVNSDLTIGFGDAGLLDVLNGGLVQANALRIGSSLDGGGTGTLNVTAGGRIESTTGIIASGSDSMGVANIQGAGSTWLNSGNLRVGDFGAGAMNVTAGALVQNGFGSVGVTEPGTVRVDGLNSRWVNSDLTIGFGDAGLLDVVNGGLVQANVLRIGSSLDGGGTGTLNVTTGGRVESTSSIVAEGNGSTGLAIIHGAGSTWSIDGTLGVGGDPVSGTSGGTGTLRIQPGATVIVAQHTIVFANDELRLEGGTFSSTDVSFRNGGTFAWTSGTLHAGIFRGSLVVPSGGVLAPGNSVGSTEIRVDYSQTAGGVLQIEIGGPAATQHDRVTVLGDAVLGGNLQLALLDSFLPSPTSTMAILNARLIAGAFANVANGQRLTTTDGLGSFIVNYGAGSAFNPREIVLSNFLSAAGLPGDYNDDGTVDAADYVVWCKFNGTATTLPNDPNGVPIDGDQYNTWKANFGATSGPGGSTDVSTLSTVAEPGSLLLVLAGGSLLAAARRRA